MLKGLYTGYTGMINEQHRMDVLTNNLANSNTIGYKKEGTTSQSFNDILTYKIKDTSESPNLPKKIGTTSLGVKIGENYTDYSAGSLRETGNVYDMAVNGSGFFAIEFTNKAGETSTKYTRDGSFIITEGGYLTTKDGDFVLDDNGKKIKLDPLLTSSVANDGTIWQDGEEVAKVGIVDFEDYNYLEHYGETLFQTVEGATVKKNPEQPAQVLSGYLEYSNVQAVREMVDMISVSRAYETNQKVIQTYDSSLEIAVTQLGKV